MFGFQRIGDLIWAAGDAQARGFLVGGTSGRTTLAGEGLQHQDGHSHVLALSNPVVHAYDPAYAYEIAVIVRDGIHRMFEKQENIMYYLTVMNEFYKMPPMPEGVEEGILKGIYKFRESSNKRKRYKAHLLGSGTILNEAVKAQELLEDEYDISADVWSVTSYKELYNDAMDVERRNMLNPDKDREIPYIGQVLEKESGIFVAASDYMKVLPASIACWIPGPFTMLGTDGFGRSEDRAGLRDFFEVDYRYIAFAAISSMARENKIKAGVVKKAVKDLNIDVNKTNPLFS